METNSAMLGEQLCFGHTYVRERELVVASFNVTVGLATRRRTSVCSVVLHQRSPTSPSQGPQTLRRFTRSGHRCNPNVMPHTGGVHSTEPLHALGEFLVSFEYAAPFFTWAQPSPQKVAAPV